MFKLPARVSHRIRIGKTSRADAASVSTLCRMLADILEKPRLLGLELADVVVAVVGEDGSPP